MRRKKTSKHVIETEEYRFILYQIEKERWKVDGEDINGSRRRYRFDAWDLQEAIDKAKSLLKLYSNQNATAPPILQIPDVVVNSIKSRNWTKVTSQNDDYACGKLYDWLELKGFVYWHELTRDSCLEYKNYLIKQNFAYDTIRLYFYVLRRASAWMSFTYPSHYLDICAGINVQKSDSLVRVYKEREFLTIHEILWLMDHINKQNKPPLVLGVGLQGLCCMRLLEVLRLTVGDIDLANSTITIQGITKNTHSIRRIPIPRMMTALLRRLMPEEKDAPLVKWTRWTYTRFVKREMESWGKVIEAKNLRNTLPTTAFQEGWHTVYLERYMGHVAKTVTEANYLAEDAKIGLLRKNVVDHMETIIDEWEAPADTGIIPGIRMVVNR